MGSTNRAFQTDLIWGEGLFLVGCQIMGGEGKKRLTGRDGERKIKKNFCVIILQNENRRWSGKR